MTGEVAATQVGSAAVIVTATPGDGAAIGDPPLSNLIVMVEPKVSSIVSDPAVMFRFAVVDIVDWAEPCVVLVAVIVEVPGKTPDTVAFVVKLPSGIVTVDT